MKRSNQYMDKEIMAHNLLWLRKKHGYNQSEMAQILGIGVASLRKLEHGVIPPRLTIEFLDSLYLHFQVTPSMLLCMLLE